MTKLIPVGTVSYGNFVFPASAQCRVQVEPVYMTSGFGIKYRRYHLSITAVLSPEDFSTNQEEGSSTFPVSGEHITATTPLDVQVEALRHYLTKPGQNLKFSEQGLGSFEVGAAQDLEFGPRPSRFTWEPIGSNLACRITWECAFTIAECQPTKGRLSTAYVAEYSYSVNFSIDEQGYTVRTITGMMEVLVRRKGRAALTANADQMRDSWCNFPVLIGFKRQQNYNLSVDRKTLHFQIIDTEIHSPAAYPPKVSQIDFRYQIQSTQNAMVFSPGANTMWSASLTGHITTIPGVPKAYAWGIVDAIVRQKRRMMSSPKYAVIIRHLSIEEELYGRSISVAINWTFATTFTNLFAVSGLFQEPLPGATWDLWQESMANPFSPRGNAKLAHSNNEVIPDFCTNLNPLSPEDQRRAAETYPTQYWNNGCPPKDSSWLPQSSARVTIITDPSIAFLTALGFSARKAITKPSVKNALDPGEVGSIEGTSMEPQTGGQTVGSLDTVQYRSGGDRFLMLECVLYRIGHPIEEIPYIKTINAADAYLHSTKDGPAEVVEPSRKVGAMVGCPVYSVACRRIYSMYPSSGAVTWTLGGVPAAMSSGTST